MSSSEQPRTTVYELRKLTDRWLQPLGDEVISTHDSERAALEAYDRQPRKGSDGSGRSSSGSFVPTVVVRVDPDGTESVAIRRTGGRSGW